MKEMLFYMVENEYVKSFVILLIGIAMGYFLQRSRFCIASAFSDFILFKDSNLLKAVIIFILICTVGFSFIQFYGGEGYIVDIGWRTAAGGLLFGLGMALAGSCAVGTLMRIGEGYILFLAALLGLILGGAFGAYHYDYWGNSLSLKNIIFLPKYFGWFEAVFLQVVFLLVILVLLNSYTKKSR